MAKCPAHDDRNPSLALTERDGKILAKCHAHCLQRDVFAALRHAGLRAPEREQFTSGSKRIVATYDYTDERGQLLFQIVRYEPKDFRPRCPDGRNGWIMKKHPRPVLYRLPEVLEAAIVFLVEGEKDVETLRSRGFVATTNAFGASQPWLPQYTAALAGREVIIVPDNDASGWQYAKRAARNLLGHAAAVVILDDIHKAGVKDISDWFGAGHSECELIALLEGVRAC